MARTTSWTVIALSLALASSAVAQVEETANFSIVRMTPRANARLPQDPIIVVATREEHLYGSFQRGISQVDLDDKIELLAPCAQLCVFRVPLRGLGPEFDGAGDGQLTVYDRNQTQTRTYRLNDIIDDAVPVMPELDVEFSVRSESIGALTEEAVARVGFVPPQDETHVVAVVFVRRQAGQSVGEVVRATNDVVNPQTSLELNVPLDVESCISAYAIDAAGRESAASDEVCGRPESTSGCHATPPGAFAGLFAFASFSIFLRRRRARPRARLESV